jgi:hypothetical protein
LLQHVTLLCRMLIVVPSVQQELCALEVDGAAVVGVMMETFDTAVATDSARVIAVREGCSQIFRGQEFGLHGG